jgi:hypothetical protein
VPTRGIRRGYLAQALLLALVGLLLVLDSRRAVAVHLTGPYFDLDGVPGEARLDASVWVVADMPLSRQEVESSFRIEPDPAACSSCLTVDHDGFSPSADT